MKNNLKVLDLGCGKLKVEGAIGVDCIDLEGVDLIHNLSVFPYPFKNCCIDKVYCRNILEHFDVETRSKIIEEIYRILKKGGHLEIAVPHAFSIAAFIDPTHKSYFTLNTMDYYTKNHYFSYYSEVKFKILEKWLSVQLFSPFTELPKYKKIINNICSEILHQLFKISNLLPDLMIKTFPVYSASILWILEKE